jgi:hypothetical protein
MKRLLWLGVGLAIGGLVVRAVSKKAQAYSPSGLAGAARESAGELVTSVRSFVDDVRDGMAAREQQIHQAMLAGEGAWSQASRIKGAGASGVTLEDIDEGEEDQEGNR